MRSSLDTRQDICEITEDVPGTFVDPYATMMLLETQDPNEAFVLYEDYMDEAR